MLVSLNCIQELQPGKKWQEAFIKTWPYYKKWFLIEGYMARPGYRSSTEKLQEFMPELYPIYKKLCALAGGGDLASRFLSMYSPPPYMTGCSQLVWLKNSVSLTRNYDYNPKMFEGVMLHSNWLKPVIGISDCNWGLLDGMNASGLAASLNFGGRKVMGKGFGIPIVIRYILETCDNADEAVIQLQKIPVHMAYNITLVDSSYNHFTVYLSPDRPPIVTKDLVSTNHQQYIEWFDYAAMTSTKERLEFLSAVINDPFQDEESVIKTFFEPPLYHINFEKAFVTLYTSIYRPELQTATVKWPDKKIVQKFDDFREGKHTINLSRQVSKKLTR